MKQHEVKQGECLSSIAYSYGFSDWQQLWDHPANEKLRNRRKNPNVLYPGDIICIPDKRANPRGVVTNARHTFKVKVRKDTTTLVMQHNGDAIANEPYRLEVGAVVLEGNTTAAGHIEVLLPPDATQGKIVFPRRGEMYSLCLGYLDPADTLTGAQARLRQLGMYSGEIANTYQTPYFVDAMKRFQRKNGLKVTGALDEATKNALIKAYGC